MTLRLVLDNIFITAVLIAGAALILLEAALLLSRLRKNKDALQSEGEYGEFGKEYLIDRFEAEEEPRGDFLHPQPSYRGQSSLFSSPYYIGKDGNTTEQLNIRSLRWTRREEGWSASQLQYRIEGIEARNIAEYLAPGGGQSAREAAYKAQLDKLLAENQYQFDSRGNPLADGKAAYRYDKWLLGRYEQAGLVGSVHAMKYIIAYNEREGAYLAEGKMPLILPDHALCFYSPVQQQLTRLQGFEKVKNESWPIPPLPSGE